MDIRKDVEKLFELHGVGDELPMEIAPEFKELTVNLLAGFLESQQRIAGALEKLAEPTVEGIALEAVESQPDRTATALERIADALEVANVNTFLSSYAHDDIYIRVRRLVKAAVMEVLGRWRA